MEKKQDNKILVNAEIKESKVMLFDKDNNNVGVKSLYEARKLAEQSDLDLVQVAKPPNGLAVCKIINYGAWQFQEKKKKHQQELKNKQLDLKEMWISPAIGENDLKIKMKKCEEFLQEGHKVRLVLKVARGKKDQYRLIQNKELSYNLMNSALKMLEEVSTIDVPLKGGPNGSLSVLLKPQTVKLNAKSKEVVKNTEAVEKVKLKM